MTTLDAINTRRSTRKFKSYPIEQEKLETMIEAGRYAPSSGNSQTCHFIVVRNKEVLAKLAELAQSAFAKMEITEGMYKSIATLIRVEHKEDYQKKGLIKTARKYKQVHRKEIDFDIKDWKEIERRAAACHTDTSKYLRMVIKNSSPVFYDMKEIAPLLNGMRIISANINQIAKKANETNSIYAEDICYAIILNRFSRYILNCLHK